MNLWGRNTPTDHQQKKLTMWKFWKSLEIKDQSAYKNTRRRIGSDVTDWNTLPKFKSQTMEKRHRILSDQISSSKRKNVIPAIKSEKNNCTQEGSISGLSGRIDNNVSKNRMKNDDKIQRYSSVVASRNIKLPERKIEQSDLDRTGDACFYIVFPDLNSPGKKPEKIKFEENLDILSIHSDTLIDDNKGFQDIDLSIDPSMLSTLMNDEG